MISERFTVENASIKMNYLTLTINDERAKREFELHQYQQQNRAPLFWTIQIFTLMNLIFQSFNYFVADADFLGFAGALIGMVVIGILWPIARWRK